jgi:AraC-like DNA-binding protein
MNDFLLPPAQLQSAEGPWVIAVARQAGGPRTTASHRHARGQLLGASSGLISVGTQGGQWVVPAIHAVWIPPHHPHSLRSHGPFAGWSVYIDEAACAGLPPQPFTLRVSGLLHEIVERVVGWNGGPMDTARARIAAVLLDEIATLPRDPFGLPMPQDARLLRIARAMVDDLANNAGLEEWARHGGVSARTLTRRFKAETGFSFTEWRQRARLMRALERLAAGTPVTAIALDLGYDNLSAFIAMFRRTFGVTPTQHAEAVRDQP